MAPTPTDNAWPQPQRPDWVARVNAEGIPMDIESLVPLDPEELLATARKTTGFNDCGGDEWREPFVRLVAALNEEADLNLIGRLVTRSDLLRWLEARLGIEEAYRRHPEIDAEIIDRPVIIVGRGRTGTSILFEILAQDPAFGSAKFWELTFPWPPPTTTSYASDPRIARSDHLTRQWGRITPSWTAIHECGATLPGECVYGIATSFMSDGGFGAWFHVPQFVEWLNTIDTSYQYRYYKRMLKLLQWRNPRRHWLLKCPTHLPHLPVLFQTFPDAQLILTHRDPVKAFGSHQNANATAKYIRSDRQYILDHGDYGSFEYAISLLERVIDHIEAGRIPAAQVHSSRYADLVADPIAAIRRLYESLGLTLSETASRNMRAYIEGKPQGKFGKHAYDVGNAAEIARRRARASRYQRYFDCPDEL